VPRRELLSPAQREELLTFPTDERSLIRHYTLTSKDIAIIRQHRSDQNRLGFAVQLCSLRFPGQALQTDESPPLPLVSFLASQLQVPSSSWESYARRDETRREHLHELQTLYGYKPFTLRTYRALAAWLLPLAFQTNKGMVLVAQLLEEIRQRRIIVPPLTVLERLCAEVSSRAQDQLFETLTTSLTPSQHRQLDGLLVPRPGTLHTTFSWLRQSSGAANARQVLLLLKKLKTIRELRLPANLGQLIHQNRLLQLAREGGQTTSQHFRRFDPLRRHATLVAVLLESTATITDEILDKHDRLIGGLFTQSKRAHAESFQESGKAINEKVRLYVKIGRALIHAKTQSTDPFQAIEAIVPWEIFTRTVQEAETLARPEDFDFLDHLEKGYPSLRRHTPALLETFDFQATGACQDLLKAIHILRQLNKTSQRLVPPDAPISFVRARWVPYVMTKDGFDRRYYELCVLAELRNALRSGDMWVPGSRQFKDFEEYLIPKDRFIALQTAGSLPLAITTQCETYVSERKRLLDDQLEKVNRLAAAGTLPEASLEGGLLKISSGDPEVPPAAMDLMEKVYALLPRVKITDVLLDVDAWTQFTRHFTHLRTNEPPSNRTLTLTALLAEGINLGLTKMAEACPGTSLARLSWLADWHIRDETYSKATAEIVNYHHRLPLAASWGDGTTSSSDGQRFPTAGRGEASGQINARYGQEPSIQFYTHLSDQYVPFHTRVINATVRDATYVLDGLLYHESDLRIEEHYTDTSGFTDHVFGLCHLLGFRFAPRIRDLADKRLHLLDRHAHYPALKSLIGEPINTKQITTHWNEILRLATSIKQGTVTASLMLRKLGAYPRQNGLAVALRELGRVERTLFTLDWLQDPELRRRVQIGLNKGEARNALARAVCLNRLGEIRDRSYKNQQYRASSLNLVIASIILWNTVYIDRALTALRQAGEHIPDDWLTHLSPLGWEHINLTGDYRWVENRHQALGTFRPLRKPKKGIA